MAAFNLTAQLNLVGPTNVRQIVGDIRKQLGTIKGNIDLGIDPKAIRAIAQLQSQASQISSSLNNVSRSASVATGSINDLNNAASKNQLGSVAQSAAKAASAASDLGKESSRSSKDVKILSNELAEFGRQSGLAIRRFAAFSLVSGVMYKLNSAINQALSQYIDFDRELVRVSQVTGKSVSELSSLVSEISSLASSTGVASKELIQVSSTLAQAGLSARDAEKALKALALSANAPSFDNLNDTVEGSIALMRQFGISANDLESALGSVNAVAAAFAVEASDLIAAIQRTGGVFASASRGVSEGTDALNEFIAVFTSVRATTRESAETIATGLRTIFTRIQRESTITALRELGVELRDVEGKFVGPYEAVRRLSEGLGQLDPRSQTFAAIVEELGGFRQIGKVIPLIQQFATAEAALQVAMKGGDSLAEANRQAQQALAVQLAKTREEFVALVRDFANNTAFRSFLTTTIGITKSILSLARAGRSLFPLLTIMGGFKAFSAVTQFAGGFMQGVRPSGGRGGGGDEEGIDNKALSRTMGRSVSRSIGKGLGEMLSGSKTERQAESLEQIVSILRSNAQAFNTDVSSLSQPITSLSSLLNDNNSLLSANTSGLNNVYAALVNLEAAISGKSFTGPTTARGGGRILGFAKGGTVPGSGKGDKIPALLEPGEVVMSNRAVSKYGRGNLVKMNKYAGGGYSVHFDYPEENAIDDNAINQGLADITSEATKSFTTKGNKKTISIGTIKESLANNFNAVKGSIYETAVRAAGKNLGSTSGGDFDYDEWSGNKAFTNTKLIGTPTDAKISTNAANKQEFIKKIANYQGRGYPKSRRNFGAIIFEPGNEDQTPALTISQTEIDSYKAASGGKIQAFKIGGVAKRNVGYIDYDVIANPANEAIVTKGMESSGVKGPRLYADYLTDLAVKARKDSSLQKLRAVYGVAGSGKTTLARGQGTDQGKLRSTTRFPILTPEDIQKANEVLILSSTVSKDKLDSFFGEVDRAYTLSSTTAAEKETIKAQRTSRDITGVGLEGRTPGGTMGVGKDTAIGEALLQDRLGSRSVVLGRSDSGKLRRKKGDELVQIIKKKIGFTWGGFAPMTVGHESILDAAAAQGISPQDFIFLVGANEGINDADASSYRTAIFDQDARVLLAKAGAGAKGATVLPKTRDFEIPLGFDVSQGSGRRQVVLPSKGSKVFVGEEKGANLTAKYKEAGYSVASMERTEGISATKVRELIEKGDLGGLQKLLSPGVYDLISNNIGRIQNRAKVLPDIIAQVKQSQSVKMADIEKSIQALGISRIDKKKLVDPEYAAKVQILEELRGQRDKIKSAAALEPYKLLEQLARSQPNQYGLDFSAGAAPAAKPIRTVGATQKASIGGLIQRFMAGGQPEETTPWGDAATVPEILSLLGFDKAQQIGRVADPRKLLKKRTPTEDEKAKIKAIRDEATKTYNRRIGAAKGVQTRLAGQGLKFAAVGMFGDTFPDETYDAQGTKGIRKVLITAAVMDKVLAEQLDADFGGGIESIAQQAAEKTMVGNITKGLLGGKQLELDFDRTLAVGADDITSLTDFRDPTIVQEKLKRATLTRLGSSLVDLVKAHPELTSNMRIITARSQSTVPLIQQWLADKGLALSDSQFVGVGGDAQIVSESDIPALKAAQLRTGSLFVDDSSANISAAEASGKDIETYQYGAQSTIPNPNAEASVKGILFEKMIQNLGGPGRVAGLGFDYPKGLGPAAKYFNIDPDIPTDAKRTIVGAGTIKDNIKTYLKAMGYKAGGKVSFGTGFPFPRRISNKYFKDMQKMLDTIKLEKVWEAYPKDERIVVDDERVKASSEEPFNLELFKKSFGDKISRDGLFQKMGQFARYIGLPSSDLTSFLPSQIDFVNSGGVYARASFSKDPSAYGGRGLEGVDLSEFGFSEADKQDAYGYSKLIEEKKKEVEKVLKTPVQTFDDGSFRYDETKARALWDEINDLKKKYSEKLKLNSEAIAKAKESRKASAEASGRGSINMFRDVFDRNKRQSYGTLYHEMVHQLFNTLRTRQADTFTQYKERVDSLFAGDNDDLADAFDLLDGGYKSADVVYGRSYKLSGLQSLLSNAYSTKSLYGNEDPVKKQKSDIQSLDELRDINSKANAYTKARDFRPINPGVNKLLLGGGYDQNVIDKMEDNGKEEFLTTLVQNLPRLDTNLQGVLDSTLNDLLASGGISRRPFAQGGLADATSEMASLMGGLYGNRESAPAKKQKDFGRIGLSEDGNLISAGYYRNDQRSGYVQAYKMKDNLYYVGLSKATSGYGPRLYDVVMEAVSEKGAMLTSDRSMVSAEAQKVWQYYFKNRGDVKKTPLEPENWTKNQSLIDPKLYGRRETWPPPTDPAWVLQSGYSKSPSLINDPNAVVRSGKKPTLSSGQMALQYFQRANGGRLGFADGGSVPALVSNGEAYVPPKLAKKIGYGTLSKMNQADKNGMGRFSSGGISVFKGPGSGTSDSIPTSLPVGSFIIREKATKALGLNKGGMVQRFADGGSPSGGKPNLYPGLDPKPFTFLEEMAIKAGNAFSSTESIFKNTSDIYDRYKSSFSNLMASVDQYTSALVQAGKLSVDRENLIFRAYEKAIIGITKIGDTKAAAKAEQELVAALDQATARVKSGITQSAPTPTSAANPKPIPQIVPPVKDNLDIPSKDIYLSNLSSSKIRETVSKSKSPIKDIDVSSLDLLRSTAQDAGMSITEFASGLIKARDTAIQSALEQGQGIREAALAGQEAAIAFGKLSELRSVGQDPNDALRSLLASSSRVQANVQERKAILSDPAVIAAIQETNKLVANLSEDEKLTYEAMRGLSKAQREDPAIQGIVGQLTPALEKVFESRTRQKDVIGYTIEQRQERAQTPTFAAPSIAGPTNLMEVEGVNNALAQAKADAESYAQSLRDQANNIRKQKEITIDPATLAGFEAKAQALEEKASEAEKTYGDLVNSTQDSVDWLDTEYQTAIDAMRIRAESAAKATQDVEKAMLQRAKEISAENPQLTAEEIGQKISIENVGIVAEAKAKQQEAQTAAGAAQSRVDSLAGAAGAGAAILAQDQAQAKAQAQAEADKAALEARKQQARDLGAKRAAIAVGGKRDYESDEEFEDRKKAATQKYTRQSAVEMGLAQTRFVSKREKESIEKQRQEEKAAKAQDLEKTKSTTDIQAQASETKATLLLVQALNANTNAQGGTTSALDEQVAALENSNKSLEEARIKNVEDKDANNKQTEDDSALFQDELRTIPFLDTLEDWSSSVNNFANGFAASSTDLNGKVSRMGGIFQGAASKIDSGIKGMAAALRNANTAFASTGLGKFADSFSQYGTVIGGGVTMAAQRLADMNDGFETTTGTIAQFAATTASQATIIGTMGAQFGPLGGIIGTVAGAAMGLTRAFFDMQNAATERARSELEMVKEDAMAEASASFELALSNSSSAAEDFKAGLEAMTTVINTEKELLKTDTKSSQFTRGFMGFGGVRQKTGRELQESVQSRAAAESGGAALSKQLLSGVMRSSNLTLDQTREKLGSEQFNALGGQIAEADTTFINARLAAAEQMNKDIAAGMSKTDAENKYRGAVDTARDASVRRALASQEAAIADEQYRKSVTEVRQRLEQQGTAFLKDIITATPKQRAEKRKDLEAAQGLMSGDMTKSRQQQQAAFQKAYRETSGTPMQKMEAAQQAAAETRSRQQAAAEQILSFGDQKNQDIRNARAQLLETSLREQGINPNEGMAKEVIDSLRQKDPELQAQEKAAATTEANTKAIADLTKAINDGKVGGGGSIYDAMSAQDELGKTERQNVVVNTVGAAVIGGAGIFGASRLRNRGTPEALRQAGKITEEEYQGRKAAQQAAQAEKPTKKKGFLSGLLGIGEEAVDQPTSPRKPPRRGARPPSAPAPEAEVKPQTSAPRARRTKTSAAAKGGGAIGLGFGLYAIGSSLFGGGSAAAKPSETETEKETADLEASPEIVQLLSAIEANTRNCCMGGGGGDTAGTGNQIALSPEITKEALTVAKENVQTSTEPQVSYTAGEPPEEPLTLAQSVRDEIVPLFTSAGYATKEDRDASINTIGSFATDAVSLAGVARQVRSGNLMPGPASKERSLGRTAERFTRAPVAETRRAVKQAGPIGAAGSLMSAYGAVQSGRAFMETGNVTDLLGAAAGAVNTVGPVDRRVGAVGDALSAGRNALRLVSLQSLQEGTVLQDTLGLGSDLGQVGLQTSPELAKLSAMRTSAVPTNVPGAAAKPISILDQLRDPNFKFELADDVAKGPLGAADDAVKGGGYLSKITKPIGDAFSKVTKAVTTAVPSLGKFGAATKTVAPVLGKFGAAAKMIAPVLGKVAGVAGVAMGAYSGYSADTEVTGRNKYLNTALGAITGSGTTMGDVGAQSKIGGLLGVEQGGVADTAIGNFSTLGASTLALSAMGVPPPVAALIASGGMVAQETVGLYGDTTKAAESEKKFQEMEQQSRKTRLVKDESGNMVRQQKKSSDIDAGLSADEANAVRAYAKNTREASRAKELASKTDLTSDETSELAKIKQSYGLEESATSADVQAEAERRSSMAQQDLAAKAKQKATGTSRTFFGSLMGSQVVDPVVQQQKMKDYLSRSQDYINYDKPELFATKEELPTPQVTEEPQTTGASGMATEGSAMVKQVATYGLSEKEQNLVKSQELLENEKRKAQESGNTGEVQRIEKQIQSTNQELETSRKASAIGTGGNVMADVELYKEARRKAKQEEQMAGVAGPAITGMALTQAVTEAQSIREQPTLPPNTIVDQAGNFIPAVGPAGSGAAITGGSALMNEAAAYDAETIAAANAPVPNVLQQFESKAAAGLPSETNNLFKNASADIARTQIPAPQPTQVSRGVINTGAPEGAAGMSQLFDTAAIGNALQTVFGQFVTDLQNVQLPKIPDLVTMEGKHTVEVILNGAEVLKSIEPMVKDLIDQKLNKFKTTINNATEGGISGM